MTSNKKLELATNSGENADLARVVSDLNKLKADVVALSGSVRDESMAKTRYLKQRAVERIEDWQDMGGRNIEKLEERVKSRPTQSVALAFAAGIVASFLFGGRD